MRRFNLSILLPAGLLDDVRLMRARRRRHTMSSLNSPWVSLEANIAPNVGVARDVIVNRGVTLGEWTYLNTGVIINSGDVGKFVSIGPYAIIGLENHPVNHLSTSPFMYGDVNIIGLQTEWNPFPDPPKIGHDAWIGAHATVLQGVTIGDGAIVAAGAVVTKDVKPYSIVVGIPARHVRYRFDQAHIDALQASRWWDRDQSELGQMKDVIRSGEDWLEHLG